jgi:katanin p60 ATPase-containing subunit A1
LIIIVIIQVATDVDIDEVARRTEGYSEDAHRTEGYSEDALTNVCRDASLNGMR